MDYASFRDDVQLLFSISIFATTQNIFKNYILVHLIKIRLHQEYFFVLHFQASGGQSGCSQTNPGIWNTVPSEALQ